MNAMLNIASSGLLDRLSSEASEALGQPLQIALLSFSDAGLIDWPADERAIAATRRLKKRQDSWYTSRAALQQLLPQDRRAAFQDFPACDVSISHTGEWAAALYVEHGMGCGIDIEWPRKFSPGIARHMLHPSEQSVLSPARDLLRVWTIKEALFKADMDNADKLLHHYSAADINADTGDAVRHDGRVALRYWSSRLANGPYVAVAIAYKTNQPE